MKYLTAPPNYLEFLKTKNSKKLLNGCGGVSWKRFFIPNNLFGLSIKDSCNIHDYSYHLKYFLIIMNVPDRIILYSSIFL